MKIKKNHKVGHLLSNLRLNSDSISKFRHLVGNALLSEIRHLNSEANLAVVDDQPCCLTI